MKNKVSVLLLTLALCLGLTVPALAAGPYTDVPPDYWAYDAIMRVSPSGPPPSTAPVPPPSPRRESSPGASSSPP